MTDLTMREVVNLLLIVLASVLIGVGLANNFQHHGQPVYVYVYCDVPAIAHTCQTGGS